MRREVYWPPLEVYCYAKVRLCPHCARSGIKIWKISRKLQLFSASSPLMSVFIDILSKLIRMQWNRKYPLVFKDHYKKLAKMVLMNVISPGGISDNFVNAWVFNYGPQ